MILFILTGAVGFTEILLIVGLGIFLFGASKIPTIMKNLGEGVKEFKKTARDDDKKATTEIKNTNDPK